MMITLSLSAPTDEEELCMWEKCVATPRATIALTLSVDHLDNERDVTTAAEVWKSRRDVFQKKKTLLNWINARHPIYTAKIRKDKKMLQDDKLVCHLAFVLKSMDVIAGETDIAMAIFCGLSDRYKHVIVTTATTIRDHKLPLK